MAKGIKRREEDNGVTSINKIALTQILKQCYLNGAIEECILTIKNGVAIIQAVDMTNNLTVSSHKKIGPKSINLELGLGNIDLLIKFLTSIGDNKVELNIKGNNSIEIKRKDGKRKLKYLLTLPELIATKIEATKKDPFKTLEEKMDRKIKLEGEMIKDLTSYFGILKDKNTSLKLNNSGKLSIIYGDKSEHQFEATLSKNLKGNKFEMQMNGDLLSRVFTAIEYNEENKPTLSIADEETPIMISDENTKWFLMPLIDIPF